MVWAILPLKDFASAKQRLGDVLDAAQRRQLFEAMVKDVLSVLVQHPDIEHTVVVSGDPTAQLLAAQFGASCWPEPEGAAGLSQVVAAVADTLAGNGVAAMLVVHGDLPLLDANCIDRLLQARGANTSPYLCMATDRSGEGTNCLLVSPANAIRFHYGARSLQLHCEQAASQSIPVEVLALEHAALDIDSADDLLGLISQPVTTRYTSSVVNQLLQQGLMQRLQANVAAGEPTPERLLAKREGGEELSDRECLQLADFDTLSDHQMDRLLSVAATMRDRGFNNVITYSRKIFIPLTHLCRDVCHYCTFARTPKRVDAAYLSVDEVLQIVREGQLAGCKEALFTLGEKPELRYRAAREALAEMGFASTLHYVAHVAERVFEETGVLPHINAGCMDENEIALLRKVSASMGIMLESASERLCQPGMPHYGSPDKLPALRLATIARAGEAQVPFTSGILIGIGETRRERIEALLALRSLHRRYGHLQEVIIQNFRAKPDTRMAQAPEPDLQDLAWTIAIARLVFGPTMSIQAPPNLSPGVLPRLVAAGINDWGGVSPVTPDFVNPEAPWPQLQQLARETALAGKWLQQRLTIYPNYALQAQRWLDPGMQAAVLQAIDGQGLPREDQWCAGESTELPASITAALQPVADDAVSAEVRAIVARAVQGESLSEWELTRLFQSRGPDVGYVCRQADQLRQRDNGDVVSFVVNRNINYTNICTFKCRFCAFSKGKASENLRGRPYDISADEIARRCIEAWDRGATEVCMQGGIHPDYDGNTYIDIVKTVRAAAPALHIHAFSPLEVWQGAQSLGLPLETFLQQLRAAGLDTLPGTAAEILHDDVRRIICPDKLNSQQWLEVMRAAHRVGFKTTATMMFGHCDEYHHWARHLLLVRELQQQTGGFTEFVPLPFVAREAPLYLRGQARRGPSLREALLVHAVARLALSPLINNIQVSWVKMGPAGAAACLAAGANDLGGTLMNESITRAAGADHGQELDPHRMQALIESSGRVARQRRTDYGEVSAERRSAARQAGPLAPVVNDLVNRTCSAERQKSNKKLIASV